MEKIYLFDALLNESLTKKFFFQLILQVQRDMLNMINIYIDYLIL